MICPLFSLFDLNPLIEKIKENKSFHYICGTTNFLVAKSKDINYDCFSMYNYFKQKWLYKY